jgi:hypothetical protein
LNFSIPRDRIGLLATQLESGEIFKRPVEEVAASVQVVAALAASRRPDDAKTQEHFSDIIEMLNLRKLDQERKAPVVRTLSSFATQSKGQPPTHEKVVAGRDRTYELEAASGCIAFDEGRFTFMVRATSDAPSCDWSR